MQKREHKIIFSLEDHHNLIYNCICLNCKDYVSYLNKYNLEKLKITFYRICEQCGTFIIKYSCKCHKELDIIKSQLIKTINRRGW